MLPRMMNKDVGRVKMRMRMGAASTSTTKATKATSSKNNTKSKNHTKAESKSQKSGESNKSSKTKIKPPKYLD